MSNESFISHRKFSSHAEIKEIAALGFKSHRNHGKHGKVSGHAEIKEIAVPGFKSHRNHGKHGKHK